MRILAVRLRHDDVARPLLRSNCVGQRADAATLATAVSLLVCALAFRTPAYCLPVPIGQPAAMMMTAYFATKLLQASGLLLSSPYSAAASVLGRMVGSFRLVASSLG